MTSKRFSVALLTALISVMAPHALVADDAVHVRLESSTPASGATLTEPPSGFLLTFSGSVNARLTRLSLRSASGASVDLSVDEDRAEGEDHRITASAPSLDAGEWVLVWRTTSADGHVLSGEIPFTVAASGAGADDAATPPGAGSAMAADDAASAEAVDDRAAAADANGRATADEARDGAEGPAAAESGVEAEAEEAYELLGPVLRALGSALLLAFAGLLFFLAREPVFMPGAAAGAAGLAVVLPFLLATEFVTWVLQVTGGFEVLAALGLTTGAAMAARVVLTTLAAVVWLATRRAAVSGALALLAVLAGGALGHAAGVAPALSIPLKAIHIATASVWLGGVLVLALTLRQPVPASAVHTVSTAALLSFAAVALTGVLQTVLLLGDFGALWATRYGQLVLVKAVGLLLLAWFGMRHRRMIAAGPAQHSALATSTRTEAVVLIALIAVASILAFVPLPE